MPTLTVLANISNKTVGGMLRRIGLCLRCRRIRCCKRGSRLGFCLDLEGVSVSEVLHTTSCSR